MRHLSSQSVRAMVWRALVLTAATILLAPLLAAQTVALTGATVYPVSGPKIENATVLMRDGRIAAIGANVNVPQDARTVDVTGTWITPGFINLTTDLGIVEIGGAPETVDASAKGHNSVAASFAPWEAFNAWSPMLGSARNDGITTVGVAPSGGLVSGQHFLVDLLPDGSRDMLRKAPSAMVAQLEYPGGGGAASRGELVQRLRRLLDDARAYRSRRSYIEQGRTRELAASPADLVAMQPVINGELPLAIQVERVVEIDAVLRMVDEYRIRVVLVGAAEAWMRAEELAAARIPVIVGGIRNIPGSFSTLRTRGDNAAILSKAGVSVSLLSDSYGDGAHFNARNVRFEAGNAVANGMSWDDALKALTVNPAQQMGVADRIGTLDVGNDANLVVWSGDPFEFLTQAERVYVRGRRVDAPNRQDQLMERYKTLPPRP